MTNISVSPHDDDSFTVVIDEGRSQTAHRVKVWPSDVERYAPGASAEALVRASFEFLLAREPKESILRQFELPVIERYFPEYRDTIAPMAYALDE
jgi:hypothetical protein